MNIKRAKEEICAAVRAYTARNEFGEYRIPPVHQRPILLMGPPGVGKTAIIEQAARECSVALVAYTITHHTRQSAVGLPVVEKQLFNGAEETVTSYTMSEIVASVYEKMEETGLREGLLFLDEINCVSETLVPTMLQFLQCKTFGTHKLPDGWVIVAAGNPPEYNRSVRDFDIVTLDRVRKMDVEPDLAIWKEYAVERGVHPAVLSYLDIKPEHFYDLQSTVDGKQFVTARGWEDLSCYLHTAETLELGTDRDTIMQFLQHPAIAREFSAYLDLFRKYQDTYRVDEILGGTIRQQALSQLGEAAFDERISVIRLLLDRLQTAFAGTYYNDQLSTLLHGLLKAVKEGMCEGGCAEALESEIDFLRRETEERRLSGLMETEERRCRNQAMQLLESWLTELKASGDGEFEYLRESFGAVLEKRQADIDATSKMLDNAFAFIEAVFGESQELVLFVTELSVNLYAARFIAENGCDKAEYYTRQYLLGSRQKKLDEELKKAESMILGLEML